MVGGCSEIYREKAFKDAGFSPASPLPNAKFLGETNLALLIDPSFTEKEILTSAKTAAEIFKMAKK
jgi:dTDP-4-amino-4,6-dideoxygalactose transaminase